VNLLNKNNVFAIFSLTVCLVLILPDLVQHGMFMDGVQYAIVSKNLALEKGSFWLPYLSSSWAKMYSNSFLEHPPLAYYLQSKFFLLFGYSFFTEKIYCFSTAVASAFLIYKIWTLVFKQNQYLLPYWWLAILLWFITPSVFWSFRNNMLENTLSIMVLLASYFSLKAIYAQRAKTVYVIIAGCFVFLGSLTKGVPGFFPITIFFCYHLLINNLSLKKTILYTTILIIVPLVLYALIFVYNPDAKASMLFYLKNRLLNRISTEHTVENRFTIMFWLFTDQLVNLALCLLLIIIFKAKLFLNALTKNEYKWILFFFAFGICGVLPLSFTHVQRAVYFVPALPFFGMAFAVFLAKGLAILITKINYKLFKIITICIYTFLFITLGLSVLLIGKTGRDEKVLTEINKIGLIIGDNKQVGTTNEIYEKWDFQFYLLRYYDITLDPSMDKLQDYKLFEKEKAIDTVFNYKKMPIELERYSLYKKRH